MLQKFYRILAGAVILAGVNGVIYPPQAALAACTAPATTYGTDTVTYNVPTAGTYRVWSRIQAPDATNNSYYLQLDGGCAINVGDAAVTANQWVWVDYQDGAAATKTNMTLSVGSHTFVLTGREPNVMVDRIVFAADPNCVPTGTGDNCAVASSPSVTPTVTVTPTPAPVAADLNGDHKVNVFDLSLLLTNWGKSGTGDINHDGTVSIFDLSVMLSSWTG